MNHPVNKAHNENLTVGQSAAEWAQTTLGSWRFIICQNLALAVWMVVNFLGWWRHWDPYPFILLNLMLSFQAANTGPILLIAASRQSAKDRDLLEHSYLDAEEHKNLLRENTALTQAVHDLTRSIDEHLRASP